MLDGSLGIDLPPLHTLEEALQSFWLHADCHVTQVSGIVDCVKHAETGSKRSPTLGGASGQDATTRPSARLVGAPLCNRYPAVVCWPPVPALIAPLLGLLLGVCFAWASADELARSTSGAGGTRGLLVAALFGLCILAPSAAYYLIVAPDWAWAYLLAPGRLSRATSLAVALAAGASVAVGYLAASRPAAARRFRPVARLALIPAVVIAVLSAALAHRWSVYATYAQFRGEFGLRPLAGSWLGYAVLWTVVVVAGSALWTLRALARSGDPLRGR